MRNEKKRSSKDQPVEIQMTDRHFFSFNNDVHWVIFAYELFSSFDFCSRAACLSIGTAILQFSLWKLSIGNRFSIRLFSLRSYSIPWSRNNIFHSSVSPSSVSFQWKTNWRLFSFHVLLLSLHLRILFRRIQIFLQILDYFHLTFDFLLDIDRYSTSISWKNKKESFCLSDAEKKKN